MNAEFGIEQTYPAKAYCYERFERFVKTVLKKSFFSSILLAARTLKLSIQFCYGSSVRIGYQLLQGSHRAPVRAALKLKLMLFIATRGNRIP